MVRPDRDGTTPAVDLPSFISTPQGRCKDPPVTPGGRATRFVSRRRSRVSAVTGEGFVCLFIYFGRECRPAVSTTPSPVLPHLSPTPHLSVRLVNGAKDKVTLPPPVVFSLYLLFPSLYQSLQSLPLS